MQTCRYHCAAAIRLNNLRRASLSYIVLLALDPAIAQSLASEDSLIEDLRAAFCLIAAFLFLMAHFESSGQANRFFGRRTQHNWWLLLLAGLMLLCFGEETSWGQRIFGWDTPSAFKTLNSQHETNIHNIWIFQAKALLINPNRLVSMFWLGFGLPIASQFP